MKHLIVGTAGHVDHGKTALVRALTGVDTDRLKEEKNRGITIELGFAPLTLPSGLAVDIVDVPGHERFVRQMVAGAAGIDLVVLVIAADEGVMPQTREHLQICALLGIRRGLVALTKTDMVDPDWRTLVAEDVREFLQGTFLEGAPVCPVSALAGEGLGDLLGALDAVAAAVEEEEDCGLFRLPVDRVFTMKGFGTVVTGSLISGAIAAGEAVDIFPRGVTAKIRGMQIHNEGVTEAAAGQRVAINLQGVEKAMLGRGDVLARPATLLPSRRLDVRASSLASAGRALKNRALVRFHAGTSELMARIILRDRDELKPGEAAAAQLFLEAPACCVAGDRFVLRSYSPVTTVGGGVVLDPLPKKHRRRDPEVASALTVLAEGDGAARTAVILERSGARGAAPGELCVRTGMPVRRLQKILDGLFAAHRAVLVDRDEMRAVAAGVYQDLQNRIVADLTDYHARHALKEGLSREELRTALGRAVTPKLFQMVLRDLEKAGRIVADREHVRLPGHQVQLGGELAALRQEMGDLYRDAGLAPPTLREIRERFADRVRPAESVLKVMLQEGELVKVSEDLYYHGDNLAALRERYRVLLIRDGKATPVEFKELTGLTRKFIIPLMEYFDLTKLTIRSGDQRLLREKEGK
ncbi:MAG: selenocysteine-specific translation elongation factor [Syntrophales bacterium]|jgi:selenocysteine-specific elongation factor|nr:selenocysteine-specific translation elongation factor [Syntrophales bacterium]HPB70009.1 selenocysteine-specific translation elongation factor [Syntrophales bacterium]